jgi:integrase
MMLADSGPRPVVPPPVLLMVPDWEVRRVLSGLTLAVRAAGPAGLRRSRVGPEAAGLDRDETRRFLDSARLDDDAIDTVGILLLVLGLRQGEVLRTGGFRR